MSWERELEVGLAAVRRAAVACRAVQSAMTPDVLKKQDKSPVTVADFASQAIICKALADAFPDDAVISEEDAAALADPENAAFLDQILAQVNAAGLSASRSDLAKWIDHGSHESQPRRFWTLDPIDGTKGFLRKEQYAIALALIVDGEIEVAVLGCPNLPAKDAWDKQIGAVFTAIRGQGALLHLLDDPQTDPQTVRASSTRKSSQARLCESVESGHSAHSESACIAQALGIENEPVRLDSQAKYAVVARGEADIYLRLPTRADYHEKIWDHAAGVLVVHEAGGRVTDINGKPLDFTRGSALTENQGVIVTNGGLQDAVLAAVKTTRDGGQIA
ncbi:MAG: 3'(2'),5'-bisphosphate nucleotidase [Planctomycetaceae bacterium]